MKKSLLISFVFLSVGWFLGCKKSMPDNSCDLTTDASRPIDWLVEEIPITQFGTSSKTFFVDENIGFVLIWNSGQLIKTENAGDSWQSVGYLPMNSSGGMVSASVSDIFFLDKNTGFISLDTTACDSFCISKTVLLKMTNGTIDATSKISRFDGKIYQMHFSDEQNGVAIFQHSTINPLNGVPLENVFTLDQTTDGGQTWVRMPNVEPRPFGTMRWLDSQTGFVMGFGDRIFKTTDGGQTWSFNAPGSVGLTDFIFMDAKTGYVADGSGILKTTDGGDHWLRVFEKTTNFLGFSDENHLLVSSSLPNCFDPTTGRTPIFFYETADGGQSWKKTATTDALSFANFFNGLASQIQPNLSFSNQGTVILRIRKR